MSIEHEYVICMRWYHFLWHQLFSHCYLLIIFVEMYTCQVHQRARLPERRSAPPHPVAPAVAPAEYRRNRWMYNLIRWRPFSVRLNSFPAFSESVFCAITKIHKWFHLNVSTWIYWRFFVILLKMRRTNAECVDWWWWWWCAGSTIKWILNMLHNYPKRFWCVAWDNVIRSENSLEFTVLRNLLNFIFHMKFSMIACIRAYTNFRAEARIRFRSHTHWVTKLKCSPFLIEDVIVAGKLRKLYDILKH